MKRFLLTLLGVAALCGLSPHHAAAQSVEKLSMDLGLRTADHNTDLTYTKSETTSPWFDTNIKTAAAASGGFQKIENDQFIMNSTISIRLPGHQQPMRKNRISLLNGKQQANRLPALLSFRDRDSASNSKTRPNASFR